MDADGTPRRLGDMLDDWQAADFSALDAGWRRAAGQAAAGGYSRAWLERPRGHSKTADIAVMVTWALFASRRTLKGVAAAGDADQAGLLRDAIESLRRLNPWLREIIDVQRERVVNRHTGSELAILTSDAPTSYGLTPDFIVCDEVTHWRDRALWDSLISAAAKRANCLVVVITNAGFGDSWAWEVREAVRQDPGWHFSRLAGPVASWITAERLAEQRRLLPAIAYRRLWGNEWTTGSGDALAPEDIARAVTLAGPAVERQDGWAYAAGLDLGLSRDASALVILGKHVGWTEIKEAAAPELSDHDRVLIEAGLREPPDMSPDFLDHPGTGRLRLVDVQVWRPAAGRKVDIEGIEAAIVKASERFEGLRVGADPWQAAYLVERLRKRGVSIEPVDFLANNLRSMCSATLEAFSEGSIELFDHGQLLADLRALRVEERNYGCRLVSPRGPNGHGDAATALGIGLHVLREIETTTAATIDRPLVCYP
jgi:phage terminase large subunit-like protein